MSAAELKSTLHKYIVETDDLAVLEQVKAYFQELRKSSGDNNELHPLEERMLNIGIEQADEGLLTPNNEVRKDINKWIEEKKNGKQ